METESISCLVWIPLQQMPDIDLNYIQYLTCLVKTILGTISSTTVFVTLAVISSKSEAGVILTQCLWCLNLLPQNQTSAAEILQIEPCQQCQRTDGLRAQTPTKENHSRYFTMAGPPCVIGQAIIFSSCGFFFFLLSFFFSSPNISRRTLDIYYSSTHGVALVRI